MFDKSSINKNTNSDIAADTGDESLKSPAILGKKCSAEYTLKQSQYSDGYQSEMLGSTNEVVAMRDGCAPKPPVILVK